VPLGTRNEAKDCSNNRILALQKLLVQDSLFRSVARRVRFRFASAVS